MKFMDYREGTVAGIKSRIFRISFTGELSFEVNVPADQGHYMWQKLMEAGDDRATAIYRTIGCYLGYAVPQFARFYDIRHLLLLGRVLTGKGGELIIEKAQEVLRDEFPELAATVSLSTPDEKLKRHGQAIAAASLPKLA